MSRNHTLLKIGSFALAIVSMSAAYLPAQSLPIHGTPTPTPAASKPIRSIKVHVFTWANGYCEIDADNSMTSGIVSNMDFSIIGPTLVIDSTDATYSFVVVTTEVTGSVISALQSLGLVSPAGFDATWPQQLPSLSGPASYVIVADERLSPPNDVLRAAFNTLHSYYQSHRSELAAAAQARAIDAAQAAAHPPASNPPVSFVRLEYPDSPPSYQ
jgi:hypothetical protein